MSTPTTPLRTVWGERASAHILGETLRPPGQVLPVPPATDRALWHPGSSGLHRPSVDHLLDRARRERDQPWPQTLATALADYIRADDRVGYEAQNFSRQARLTRAVVAAAVTGAAEWIDEVADGLVLLCEQSTWCWPAHEESFTRRDWLLPDPDAPVLDLGAGEVAAQVAWADHLLGDLFDEHFPGLRTRLRREVRTRVLDPYLQRRDWWWIGAHRQVNNWNPWICGNVMLAALQLLDHPGEQELRAQIVARTIIDVDNFVVSLPADGAVDEGVSYWWEGVARLLEMLDVLHHATDGSLDASAVPEVGQALAFVHRMHLGRGWYLGVADSRARALPGLPWDLPYRWARRLGDDRARAHAAAQVDAGLVLTGVQAGPANSLGRVVRTITDADFTAATRAVAGAAEATGRQDVWLPSVQVLIRHQDQSTAGLSLAVKGGHNGENHNHNDVGSVTVALDGVPVVVDPGRPTYTRQTFGPDRYQLRTMQSQWHSLPLVRGAGQVDGAQYAASEVTVVDDDGARGLELDLTGAYAHPDLRRWHRRAVLTGGRVEVVDAWDLAATAVHTGPAGPTRLHWILAGSVQIVAPGLAVVAPLQGERTLELSWDPALPAGLEAWELDDPMLTEVWGTHLTRLFVEVDPGGAPAPATAGSTMLRLHPRP